MSERGTYNCVHGEFDDRCEACTETIDHQTREWLAGNPIHNTERDECCPDFSCCEPRLLWPLEQRQEFADADEDVRNGMLMMSLGAAFVLAGARDGVHIVGLDGAEAQ